MKKSSLISSILILMLSVCTCFFVLPSQKQMKVVDDYLKKSNWTLQQVQDFIPLPMTMGCAMYCAEITPDGKPIKVNKGLAERRSQRDTLKGKQNNSSKPFYKRYKLAG